MADEYPYLIDGQWKTAGVPVEIHSPFNGEVVGLTYQAGAAEVETAIQAAKRAFAATLRWPTFRRAEILEKTVRALRDQREALARLIALEAGKPIKYARAEADRAAATFTDALEEAKRIRGEWLPLDLEAGSPGRQALVRRFPLGPIAAITPFNFPLNLVGHKVAPALACGNSLVAKPAPQAPLSALTLARFIAEAGAPPGLLNVFSCSLETAQPLVTDPRLRLLSFTGSAAVGWALKQQAGKKRVVLELGGNAAVAVHSDADLAFAAQRCVFGGFAYAGQICISVQRIYVHRPVLDTFTAKFLTLVEQLEVGDPLEETTDLGPMVSLREAERAEGWVREAVAAGARLLFGGERSGALMQPTVLTGTHPGMKVCAQEVFAPVVVLEPYDHLAQAMALINDSPYGLQAGLFTRDVQAAFAAFDELEVGGLILNDVPTYRADPMPYGGVKDSGLGREGVRYAIEEMTERKVMVLNLAAP
jgi:glyceraldehyde-3-phosphate dehydrogenase (NADP+)